MVKLSVENEVIEVAKALFLEKGLSKTEMKEIAVQVGISRSTLYRMYSSKDVLAFAVAQIFLHEIFTERDINISGKDANGYEILVQYIHQLIEELISHVEYLKYLLEFDQVFTGNYPDIPETQEYISFNRKNRETLCRLINKGIADGSIKPGLDVGELELSIGNTVLAIAQRILPREKHYYEEYGMGREIVYNVMDMILSSIRQE